MSEIEINGVRDLSETEMGEVRALTGLVVTLTKFREDYQNKSGSETVDDIVAFITVMLKESFGIISFGLGGTNEIS